jgi:hypothetical protein
MLKWGYRQMGATITAVFDGKVLRPDAPVELKPNTRYRLTVDGEIRPAADADQDAWEVLEELAGAVEAPSDWAAEHDHYLYGTPKSRK